MNWMLFRKYYLYSIVGYLSSKDSYKQLPRALFYVFILDMFDAYSNK